MIVHCMKKSTWDERKQRKEWGHRDLEDCGFVHCSTVNYLWRVMPNFLSIDEPLVLVCLDESKLRAEVKYEDSDGVGRFYPHVYGLINNSAVLDVLPFLKDEHGNWLKNDEFSDYPDE